MSTASHIGRYLGPRNGFLSFLPGRTRSTECPTRIYGGRPMEGRVAASWPVRLDRVGVE